LLVIHILLCLAVRFTTKNKFAWILFPREKCDVLITKRQLSQPAAAVNTSQLGTNRQV